MRFWDGSVFMVFALGLVGNAITPRETQAQGPVSYDAPLCHAGTGTGVCGSIGYSTLNPAEGAAFTDPDFVHSTASVTPCGTVNLTCIVRITGPNFWAAVGALPGGNPCPNASGYSGGAPLFHTPSATDVNVIDVADDEFLVSTAPSTCNILVNFNKQTGAFSINQVFTLSGGTSEPHASKLVSRKWYGYPSATQGTKLIECDTRTNPCTQTQLADLAGICNYPVSTAGLGGGGWDTSLDNNRYSAYVGPQNTARIATVYDRASGGCLWYDVVTGNLGGGGAWPGGVPSCTGCAPATGGAAGTGIHGFDLCEDGNEGWISLNGIGVTLWNFSAGTAWHASSADGQGHLACGQHTVVTGPSTGLPTGTSNWLTLDTRTPANTVQTDGVRMSPCCDQHNSWVTVNSGESNLMYTLPYGNGTNNPCQDGTQAGVNELSMVNPLNGDTWRFLHARKNICGNANLPQGCTGSGCTDVNYFYHATSGNVSRDGVLAVFNSNWDLTLGTVTYTVGASSITVSRDDVFVSILQGQVAGTLPLPPTGFAASVH